MVKVSSRIIKSDFTKLPRRKKSVFVQMAIVDYMQSKRPLVSLKHELKVINIEVTDVVYENMNRYAKSRNISISELVKNAVHSI